MPRYIIERNMPIPPPEAAQEFSQQAMKVAGELGIRWIRSYVSEESSKIYCEYESPSVELVREHARRLNVPADKVSQVSLELDPTMFV